MKTVLHVITSLGSGGAERMLTRIATTQNESVRQCVISLNQERVFEEQLLDAGVYYRCMNMRGFWQFPMVFLALFQEIRRLKPDFVMTWLYHADFLGYFAARCAGIRPTQIAWNIRCSNLNFEDFSGVTRLLAFLLARLSPCPGCIVHNARAGRRSHEALGYVSKNWLYIPNGFEKDVWKPDHLLRQQVRERLGLDDNHIAVCMTARYSPQKDFSTFMSVAERVLRRHENVFFFLIGRDIERINLPEAFKTRIKRLGLRKDIPDLLTGMDIGILTSAYGEGFPNVIGEAMMSGLPCVVTDVGDSADIVAETGLVVPPNDPESFAMALDKIISLSETERLSLGQAARKRAVENWDINKTIAQYFSLWND